MQFLFDENAGNTELSLSDDAFKHLKVRRVRENECINLRNLKDDFLYIYEIKSLFKSRVELILRESITQKVPNIKPLSLALSIIEPKIIEKTIPILNELGLTRLIFVQSDFSQGNFKLDFERLNRILINSCEQCGRANLMKFELFNSTIDFKKAHQDAIMVDFSGEIWDEFNAKNLSKNQILNLNENPTQNATTSQEINKNIDEILSENEIFFIGAEGGFSDNERTLFKRKIRLKSPYILRSQSAIIAIAAKILA